MPKLDTSFTKKAFESEVYVRIYEKLARDSGLWKSETIVFTNYFSRTDRILDVGCGTGRTTFGLYKLGFINIEGIDLSDGMIEAAKRISYDYGIFIPFRQGDATSLPYADESFDAALFSFNGLMQIPGRAFRVKAMQEVYRVLRPGSVFVFTTHPDRDSVTKFAEFWKTEKAYWDEGLQDEAFHDFGDRYFDMEGVTNFIHIPGKDEVAASIRESGFELVENCRRSSIATESDKILSESEDLIFWVVKK